MGQAELKLPMSADEFLAWDAQQTVKHEFLSGEVFAMAGAGEAHVTLGLNVAMALRQHLQGSPCRTFITDMMLRVEAADAFFYPDVMVTCAPADVPILREYWAWPLRPTPTASSPSRASRRNWRSAR